MSEHVVPFQPGRFQGAAPHYLQGRPPYAAGLYRRVAAACGLGLQHQALDLGCGPGQLAAGFALFAGSVLAIDPEPAMLAIAAARIAGVLDNVRFVQGSSYDLAPPLGPFRLVSIGRAFHWMDRADTLRRLDAITMPGAAVALITDHHPHVPANGWLTQFRAIRTRVTGSKQPAWRQPGWPSHETLLLDSAFCRLERIGLFERRRFPAAQLADRALSMSSSSRSRLGEDGAARLAAEITALAESVARDGLVEEVVETVALLAFRPD